jgi:hypothetical protein
MRAIAISVLFLATALRASAFSLSPSFASQRRTTTAITTAKSNNDPDSESATSVVTMQTWNPFRLAVLRLGLTEPMNTSPFNYGRYNGTFHCAYCGHALFDSNAKYDSGSGWPSFWRSLQEGAISYRRDLDRMECQCGR